VAPTTPPVRHEPVDGSVLCLECGLCCDGTLFKHTELEDSEIASARSVGAPLIAIDAGQGTQVHAIPQRCALFQGGCCSTFGRWRPKTCGDYTCELLDGFVGGSRTLQECLATVRDVRDVAEAVRRNNLDAARGEAPPEAPRMTALLEVLRRRYFKVKGKRPASDPEGADRPARGPETA